LPANAGGFETHRDTITIRLAQEVERLGRALEHAREGAGLLAEQERASLGAQLTQQRRAREAAEAERAAVARRVAWSELSHSNAIAGARRQAAELAELRVGDAAVR
jgi:hypothetical protein